MEIDTTENKKANKNKVYYFYGKKGNIRRDYKNRKVESADYYLEVMEKLPYNNEIDTYKPLMIKETKEEIFKKPVLS